MQVQILMGMMMIQHHVTNQLMRISKAVVFLRINCFEMGLFLDMELDVLVK